MADESKAPRRGTRRQTGSTTSRSRRWGRHPGRRCCWPGAALVLAVALAPGCARQAAEVAEPAADGPLGMVSSAHPLATQVGLHILESGGNAFDAAVAVAATLNVVEPMMSGIGGYGTILTWEAERGEAAFLNASDRIPRAVDADLFRAPTLDYEENRRGAKAVSTPGNLRAWEAMAELGRLPWADVLAPAIRAAEQGFEIDERTAALIAAGFDDFPTHARAIYGHDDEPLVAGQRLVQADLAATLRALAEQGAELLYGGSLGEAVAATMQRAGGFLSMEDLIESRAEWWDPISIDYRGHRVVTASPPSTAFPSLIRLGIMSRFDPGQLGHNTPAYLHTFAEATKQAFWTRLAYAGDPDVRPPPLDSLLSEAYWQEQAAAVDPERARPFEYPEAVVAGRRNATRAPVAELRHATQPEAELQHTTHFVVADRWGNVVSATQTLGNLFGSRIMPEGTGVWLNNSLAYCTFEPPGNPMDAHPGRRKLSGDCPTFIVREGKPWVAIGTPGGHTIGQTVPQMVMNLIDFGMDVQAAIDAPRIAFLEPDTLGVERSIPEGVWRQLESLGHNVRLVDALGNAHGLAIEYDAQGRPVRFSGGADRRGTGLAEGR